MGRRGPKPKPKGAPRQPLCVEPPGELGLSAEATKEYRKLASRLLVEGWACQGDQWSVALAAEAVVCCRQLRSMVFDTDGKPDTKLLRELRAERANLATLLDRLFLSPRARARGGNRMGETALRQAQEMSESDPLLEFL